MSIDSFHGRLAPGQLPRLLPSDRLAGLDAHLAWFGPLPSARRGLLAELERSGLRGRGGAGFPTSIKWQAVASHGNAVVVANGTEGEPASAKDRTLLTVAPHLVLDGIALAAVAVGAGEAHLCIDRRHADVRHTLEAALEERRGARIDPVPIRLERAPGRYLTGEESALVHWLNGGEAKPTFVPPRPFERGVRRRPTLVQNVETLAHAALIARFGSDWFRSLGTKAEPGSMVFTVGGAVRATTVTEAAFGTPLTDVVRAAGGDLGAVSAVLVGGYFGTWVSQADASGLALSAESLARAGASLGCGSIVALPAAACGLTESARVARWLADQSAGQCGPCLHGLNAIAGGMATLARGDRGGKAEADLSRWLDLVKGRGACKHPDGAARFVESSLRTFAGEIAQHRRHGPCRTAPVLPVPETGGWR